MRVHEIMTTNVITCDPATSLAEAAVLMWENDCGSLPVTDADNRVVGLITDRDISIAVATRNRLASEIAVREVTSGQVHASNPNQRVQDLLQIIQKEKVRRVPVVDDDGKLQGIVSISDIVLQAKDAQARQASSLSTDEAIATLRAVCGQHELQSRKLSPQSLHARSRQ